MDFEDQSFHSPYPNPLNDFTSNRNTVEPHYRGSVATDVSRCRDYSSDEFDTDLEIEGNEKKSNDRDKRDDLAPPVDIYLSTCAMYSTPPQTSVTKDLQRREISVRHRSLSAKDLASIAVALAKSGVERVDLRGNDLRGEGVTFIQTAVALNQNITYLDLSENNLGSSFEGAVTVGEMLRYNKTLTELHLSGNHFKDADSVYLAAGIAVNSRLETLDLSRNNFEEDGGMHVGRAIGKNCTIVRLDLSWNSIRRRGAVALCRGLQENTGIREIDLAHNGFGYEGALAVGELLSKNTQLQRLDLSSNQINWNGAMFVAKGLAKNKTLEVLRLNSNQLTTTGCMDLIEAVSGSSSPLRILTIKNVPVIEKFESVAKEIQHKRAFYFEHGGIVPSHDVLGQRPEKQLKPMQKVINHMKSREYRPLEMFRLLDLNVDRQLTREDLLDRMKKIGVADLHKHELEALFEILQSSSSQTANKEPENVVYKNLIRTVKDHIERQRDEERREQRSKERLRLYHEKILDSDVISVTSSVRSIGSGVWSSTGGTCGSSARGRTSRQVAPLATATTTTTPPSQEDEEAMQRQAETNMAAMITGLALENRQQSRQGVTPTTTTKPDRGAAEDRKTVAGKVGRGGGPKIMSLSTKLGANSRPFGKAEVKKSKKKKTKKKNRSKKKAGQYLTDEYTEFEPE